MECYRSFSKIYDELICNDINYHKMSKLILDTCEKYNVEKSDYVDLACGTGNLTREVGKNFKNVWAVDLSCDMLGVAEEKLREVKLKPNLVCQDMSELNLMKKFNLITCALDSTNYICDEESLKQYFIKVFHHLKDDGIFIFDINSHYKITEILGDNIFTYDDDNIVYIWDNVLENDIVTMYLTFFIKEDDIYKRFDEEHVERAYSEEFLDKLLNEIGFEVLEKLDDYNNVQISQETERIVYILRKKN